MLWHVVWNEARHEARRGFVSCSVLCGYGSPRKLRNLQYRSLHHLAPLFHMLYSAAGAMNVCLVGLRAPSGQLICEPPYSDGCVFWKYLGLKVCTFSGIGSVFELSRRIL